MKKEFFKQHNKPVNAIWLGQKTPDKVRPIKLKFTQEKYKWEVLTRANSVLRNDKIFCKLDLSKQARDKEYSLRQQLRELKTENTEVEYRLRNQTIQQKSERSGECVNLTQGLEKHRNV